LNWLKNVLIRKKYLILILVLAILGYALWGAAMYPYNSSQKEQSVKQYLTKKYELQPQPYKIIYSIDESHSSIYLTQMNQQTYITVLKKHFIFPRYKVLKSYPAGLNDEVIGVNDGWNSYALKYNVNTISIHDKILSVYDSLFQGIALFAASCLLVVVFKASKAGT